MNRKRKEIAKPEVRCAIYTRKSCEEGLEQDFNSLDAQRESGEAFIASQQHEGWVCLPEAYEDIGYSAGNMNRPALQRLLADVQAGKIDCVVIHTFDRLTRSFSDSATLWAIFRRCGVTLVTTNDGGFHVWDSSMAGIWMTGVPSLWCRKSRRQHEDAIKSRVKH